MYDSKPSQNAQPHACFAARQRQVLGFTIIEVMVVVAVLGVLAALAAPSFGPLIERWRVRDAAESLKSTLFYARSEAIKRGGNVTILRTPNGNGCTNASATTQWGCGWSVFIDTNNNGIQNTGEDTLKTMPALTRVEINLDKSNGYITLDRWGQLDSNSEQSFAFRLMPQGTASDNAGATAICVVRGGHIKRLPKGDDTCP